MLAKAHPSEVILALKPLLVNTPRSPRTANTPNAPETGVDVQNYLTDVMARAAWVTCPECSVEWNALTESGICISCFDAKEEKARKERALYDLLGRTIGPYGLENYRFDNFKTDSGNVFAHEAFSAFNHATENLYLYGACGTGKTHLAGALMKAVSAKTLSVKWVNPVYMAMELQGKFPSEHKAFIDELASYEALIIDDLGAGDEFKATCKAVYLITDKRKANKKNGLVITSNLSVDDLYQRLKDDRVTSRITGLCRVIQLIGTDRRIRERV